MAASNFIPATSSTSTFRGIDGGIVGVVQEVVRVSWGADGSENLVGEASGKRLPVSLGPAGTLGTGAETAVGATAVVVLAADAGRQGAVVQNVGTANIRVGAFGVTSTTGIRLVPDGILLFGMPSCPTADLYAIRESTSDSIAMGMGIV